MANDLLQEALADVDSLIGAAEENAVNAVIEAVTPRIRNLIESKMIEPVTGEDEDSSDDGVNESINERNYVLDANAIKKLSPLIESIDCDSELTIEFALKELTEKIDSLLESSDCDSEQISMAVSSVENMYEYVRENVNDKKERMLFEGQLNNLYERMKAETTEESQMSKKLNEEDLTLKLSGLPELEDEDLENVEVELVADEEDEGGEEELDIVGDDEVGGEEAEEFDLSGFGEEEPEGEDEDPFEENTVYEIDESVLAAELKKMQESAVDQSCLDDFGGGKDDGDPWLDSDLPDVPGTKECCADGTMKEADELEDDDVEEACNEDEVKAKLQTESSITKNIMRRLNSIKSQYKSASSEESKTRLKEAYKRNKKRLVESKNRVKALKESVSHSNNGKEQSAGNNAALVSTLRKQLAESNLNNQKLQSAVKVLQHKSLSNAHKKKILESLKKATKMTEVKKINERVLKVVKRASMNESAQRNGTASAPMRSAGSSNAGVINEGLQTDRWQKLAGLGDK